jgi:hypothetical protein
MLVTGGSSEHRRGAALFGAAFWANRKENPADNSIPFAFARKPKERERERERTGFQDADLYTISPRSKIK